MRCLVQDGCLLVQGLTNLSQEVFCTCRMPNNVSRAMILCDCCKQYFYMNCMELDCDKFFTNEDWSCSPCLSMLTKLAN